jgi:anthranilate synthase component 1
LIKVPINSIQRPIALLNSLLRQGLGASLFSINHEGRRFTVVSWSPRITLRVLGNGEYTVDGLNVQLPRDPLKAIRALIIELRRAGVLNNVVSMLGYVSYDAVVLMEHHLRDYMSPSSEWDLAHFFVGEYTVLYDESSGKAYLVNVDPGSLPKDQPGQGEIQVVDIVRRVSRSSFESSVEEALRLIEAGEVFQVVLSRDEEYRFVGKPVAVLNRLHSMGNTHYLYYMDMGDEAIVGASPELLVRVDEGRVETHPIAGTRPRGRDEEEDMVLEDELLSSVKDSAEHMMLVDLARNDLGRVCIPGTVRVTRPMYIEKFSHVQHIVTRVEGWLRQGEDAVSALEATFPAGTVSGAPKPRAMEIISKLEERPRGPYAGAVGYVKSPVDAEFAILIRSAYFIGDRVRVQAGAGIVYDSKPDLEWLETESKLMNLKLALGVIHA